MLAKATAVVLFFAVSFRVICKMIEFPDNKDINGAKSTLVERGKTGQILCFLFLSAKL